MSQTKWKMNSNYESKIYKGELNIWKQFTIYIEEESGKLIL